MLPEGFDYCRQRILRKQDQVASNRKHFLKPYSCRKQFSIKVGTVLEDSKLPLAKWLPAFWSIVNGSGDVKRSKVVSKVIVGRKKEDLQGLSLKRKAILTFFLKEYTIVSVTL